MLVRDIITSNDPLATEEALDARADELIARIEEIEKLAKKAQQFRQKLASTSRQLKPKQHRTLRFGLARTIIDLSHEIQAVFRSRSPWNAHLVDKLRRAVEEFKGAGARDRARRSGKSKKTPATPRICAGT